MNTNEMIVKALMDDLIRDELIEVFESQSSPSLFDALFIFPYLTGGFSDGPVTFINKSIIN